MVYLQYQSEEGEGEEEEKEEGVGEGEGEDNLLSKNHKESRPTYSFMYHYMSERKTLVCIAEAQFSVSIRQA